MKHTFKSLSAFLIGLILPLTLLQALPCDSFSDISKSINILRAAESESNNPIYHPSGTTLGVSNTTSDGYYYTDVNALDILNAPLYVLNAVTGYALGTTITNYTTTSTRNANSASTVAVTNIPRGGTINKITTKSQDILSITFNSTNGTNAYNGTFYLHVKQLSSSLSASGVSCNVGSSFNATSYLSGTNSKSYIYSGYSSDIISVSGNTITVKNRPDEGYVNISVYANVSNNYAKSSTVTLKVTIPKLTQAALNVTSPATLNKGDTSSITVTGGTGDGAISYKSSDNNVLTIDSSGNITAVAPGSATVTVTKSGTLSSGYTNYNDAVVTKTIKVIGPLDTPSPTYSNQIIQGLTNSQAYLFSGTDSSSQAQTYSLTSDSEGNIKLSDHLELIADFGSTPIKFTSVHAVGDNSSWLDSEEANFSIALPVRCKTPSSTSYDSSLGVISGLSPSTEFKLYTSETAYTKVSSDYEGKIKTADYSELVSSPAKTIVSIVQSGNGNDIYDSEKASVSYSLLSTLGVPSSTYENGVITNLTPNQTYVFTDGNGNEYTKVASN